MDVIREKEILKQQLLEAVSRLSQKEQEALWKMLVHRGLIDPKSRP